MHQPRRPAGVRRAAERRRGGHLTKKHRRSRHGEMLLTWPLHPELAHPLTGRWARRSIESGGIGGGQPLPFLFQSSSTVRKGGLSCTKAAALQGKAAAGSPQAVGRSSGAPV